MKARKQTRKISAQSDDAARLLAELLQIDSPLTKQAEHNRSQRSTSFDAVDLTPSNPVIRDMYLEINSIAQGLNIGLLVLAVTDAKFLESIITTYYASPLLAISAFIISVNFWVRNYFDTEMLNRSYTMFSSILFFGYVITQGIGISFVSSPLKWFTSTGVFLLFAFAFYAYNLIEIERKQGFGVLPPMPAFIQWQRKRLIDMAVLCTMAFVGAYLVLRFPDLTPLAAITALILSIWQSIITDDYRRSRFLRTGI